MRASRWFGVVLSLLLLTVISSIALADGGVVVSTEPQSPLPATGEAAEPIALKMAPDETTATFALYLHNTTTDPLENLALFAYLENARGQTLPEVGLEFLDPVDDQPLDSFSLPAGGQSQVLLQVDNLTAFGTFTGTITLQRTRTLTPSAEGEEATTETTLQVLASFSLEKPGQPQVVVQGADENGNLSRTVSTPDADLHLELLEENGQVPVDDLTISLSGAAGRSDGASGPEATLTWSSDGQTGGTLALPAHGRRTLTLHATLPEATAYRGWLDLQYGDQVHHYTLLITRAASPAVEIQEAGAGGTLPLVVRSATFESTVTLQLPYGQAAVQDLVVTVGDPRREDGSPTDSAAKLGCSVCDGQAYPLEAGTPLQIAITGQGLETGTYQATMILSYRNERQEVPLRITRSALASNLDLGQPETGDGINWPWPFRRGATVEVKAIVTETAGQATEINYPTLELLSRLDQKGKRYSVSGETIELLRQADSGERTIVSAAERNETLDLAAREQATFVYRIDNLARAGTYSGKVRVLGPDSTAVEQEFTITVKDAWPFAFLTILIGVVLSYLLRQWRRTGRIRNLRAANIARLEVEIQALHDEAPEDPVWTNLLGQLRILQTRNRVEEDLTDKVVDDALKRIGERQNKYQQALAARDKIGRLLQKYPTEPEDLAIKKRAYEEEAQALFETLQGQLAQPGDAGLGPTEAPQTLTSLQHKRDEIEVHAVLDPAEKLQAQVDDLVAEIDAGKLSAALEMRTGTLKGNVDTIVGDVQKKGAQIPVLADRLAASIEDYAGLRLEQLAELLHRLDAQQAAEAHVQDWGAVDTRQADAWTHHGLAQDQATAAGKLQEWKEGRHDYLGASIEFLSILAGPRGRPPDIDAGAWQRLRAGVPDLQRNVQEAAAAWNLGSPEAERAFQRAREEYLKLLVEVMRLRIEATGDLVRQQPVEEFVPVDDWTKILAGKNLAPRLAALDGVTKALPTASDTPQDRRKKYDDTRQRYVVAQVQALQAGHAELSAYYKAHKDEGANPQDPFWTKTIPAELATMAADIEAANDKLASLSTEEALLDAEAAARQAQYQYALSLEKIEEVGTTARGVKDVVPIELVQGLASAIAAIPVALAAALSVPSREDLAEKQVPPYAPKPPGHYLRRVLWLDALAALVALVIASIAGLSALWVGETAFGGVLYLSAFLWGFGLTAATTGVADVWTKLGVPTS